MEHTPIKWYRFLWNKYLIFGIAFVIWMLFFDENSYIIHQESDVQIQELEELKEFYSNKIKQEKQELEQLKNEPAKAEKIARERYFMRKSNEDIFLIEFDKKGN